MMKFLRWLLGAGETGKHRVSEAPPPPEHARPPAEPRRPASRPPRADDTLADGPPRVSPRIDHPRERPGPAAAVRAWYAAVEDALSGGTP